MSVTSWSPADNWRGCLTSSTRGYAFQFSTTTGTVPFTVVDNSYACGSCESRMIAPRRRLMGCLLLLAASAALAEQPVEFVGARISVFPGATVVRHPYRELDRRVPAPKKVMDVYVWRESGLAVSTGTKPEQLGHGDLTVTLAEDVFEIREPKQALIVTGFGPMEISTGAIRSVAPFDGPLNGRRGDLILPVSARDAKLLRSGPPKYSCRVGGDRYLLSWTRDVCRNAAEQELESLSQTAGIVVMKFEDEDH
ncbi:MAG: hypothetical protein M0D55_09600 [Elusimicrobiota bacterium]|nr:MAG: hypothetical protein M0D55_09600 [Elusimicrobiota bacterium]